MNAQADAIPDLRAGYAGVQYQPPPVSLLSSKAVF